MSNTMNLVLAAGLMAAGCLSTPALSFARQAPPSVVVEGRIIGTTRTGPTGAPIATRIRRAKVGERAELAMTFDEATGGVSAAGRDGARPAKGVEWLLNVSPISVEIDTARLEVDWQRIERATGVARRTAGDRRTVSMRRGQRRVLDLIQPSGEGALSNVVVELEVMSVVDPAYSGLTLSYELWFVEEDPAGQTVARRAVLAGGQGERVPFSFTPISYSLDRSGASPGVTAALDVILSGDVSGRLRADGTLDVTVAATRVLRCGGGGQVSRETGQRDYNARPDGTVALELPVPEGSCGLPAAAEKRGSEKPGVSILEGKTWIAFDRFFKGTRASLLVTVRRSR